MFSKSEQLPCNCQCSNTLLFSATVQPDPDGEDPGQVTVKSGNRYYTVCLNDTQLRDLFLILGDYIQVADGGTP